nr:hypothetical protein [Trueperaceae bacterium]
ALRCAEHADHERDLWLGEASAADLDRLLRSTLREGVHSPPVDRPRAWRALLAHAREHVGEVRSLVGVVAAPPRAATGTVAEPTVVGSG